MTNRTDLNPDLIPFVFPDALRAQQEVDFEEELNDMTVAELGAMLGANRYP